MIQAESQLKAGYGEDGQTIIGNCDTYVYLGGNDVDTAQAVARRCDVPLKRILNMPVGTNWVFRRGSEPLNGKILDLNRYLEVVEAVLKGNSVLYSISYRARKADGAYVFLKPRGFVICDSNGEPEYFGGIIIPQ